MAKYFQIWPSFWRGDRRRWPRDRKLLAMYLLSCEHRSLEGYYFLPKGYIIADLDFTMAEIDEHLGALIACGFCSYDEDAQVIFVVKALEHDAPKGPKRVPGAVNALRLVPHSSLWPAFLRACAVHAPELAKALRAEPSPSPDTPSEPFPPDAPGGSDIPSEALPYAGAHSSSSSSNNNSKPEAAAAREHTRESLRVETALGVLAGRLKIAAPAAADVTALLVDHPDKDIDKALDEIKAWSRRRKPPGNLLASFASVLAAAPAVPIGQRQVTVNLTPAAVADVEQWESARARLQEHVSEATWEIYLAPLTLAGVADEALVLSGAREIVGHLRGKYLPVIAETVGRPVQIIETEAAAA